MSLTLEKQSKHTLDLPGRQICGTDSHKLLDCRCLLLLGSFITHWASIGRGGGRGREREGEGVCYSVCFVPCLRDGGHTGCGGAPLSGMSTVGLFLQCLCQTNKDCVCVNTLTWSARTSHESVSVKQQPNLFIPRAVS